MPPSDGSKIGGGALHDDPSWQAALDWFLRIQAAPDDMRLRRERDAWLAESAAHAAAYARAEQVWQLAGEVPAENPGIVAAKRHSSARPFRVVTRRRTFGITAVALAAGLILAFLPSLALRLQADHITGIGETRAVVLSDGSTVHLDAKSALDVAYSPARRSVGLLSGQAFFEVVSGDARPFRVAAEGVTVTVTGTAFSVSLDPRAVTVAVQSGAVDVGVGPEQMGLVPGDRLRIDRATGEMVPGSVTPGQIASWRGGRLIVDNATVADVVEEFRRYHRGVIILRDDTLASRRVTGVFDLHDPDAGLRAVLQPHGGRLTAITPWVLLVASDR